MNVGNICIEDVWTNDFDTLGHWSWTVGVGVCVSQIFEYIASFSGCLLCILEFLVNLLTLKRYNIILETLGKRCDDFPPNFRQQARSKQRWWHAYHMIIRTLTISAGVVANNNSTTQKLWFVSKQFPTENTGSANPQNEVPRMKTSRNGTFAKPGGGSGLNVGAKNVFPFPPRRGLTM